MNIFSSIVPFRKEVLRKRVCGVTVLYQQLFYDAM